VQGASADPVADRARQQEVVQAFLAAARDGRFDALLALLDPNIVVRADQPAVEVGASKEVRGAEAVAGTFSGRARAARAALVGGAVGLVWMQQGQVSMVFDFTIEDGKVVQIELIADPERIRELEPTILGA